MTTLKKVEIGKTCLIALIIYQFGMLFSGNGFTGGTIAALITLVVFLIMLFRPAPKARSLDNNTLQKGSGLKTTV
ncbi:hypothetical protein DSECCO2_490750 [anaerobic digester metagenome]